MSIKGFLGSCGSCNEVCHRENKDDIRNPAGKREIIVALAGQPNTGKSTVFNRLTGMSQHVGNWPGKTVDCKTGCMEKGDRIYTFVDLPGCYGLSANSLEERIARDYAVSGEPDVIVAIVNAAAIERSLYLVAELVRLKTSVVVALNMVDVANQEGIRVDAERLSAAIGIPVVPMIASRNKGINDLLATLDTFEPDAPQNRPKPVLPSAVSEIQKTLGNANVNHYPSEWTAVKVIEGDSAVIETLRNVLSKAQWKMVEAVLAGNPDAFMEILQARQEYIENVCKDAVTTLKKDTTSPTDKWDRAFLHPFWGPVIALFIIPMAIAIALTVGLFPAIKIYEAYFAVRCAVMDALPGMAGSLLSNGIMLPVAWIAALSIVLFILFAVLSFFEDIGYLARITYLTDRLMRRIGLTGKSVIPLFFGFICNACSVLGSRVIETRRQQLQTIAMIPFIPCSAQIAVAALFAVVFFPYGTAIVIVLMLIASNIVFAGMAGKLIQRYLPDHNIEGMVMELPVFHRPNLRTILMSAWTRIHTFIKRGATLMLPVMMLFWAISYFPDGNIQTSYIARAGHLIEPATHLMGLDWRFTGALLFSFIAKENTLTALSIFLLTGNQDQIYFTVHGPEKDMVIEAVKQSITPAGALAFMVASNFFIPCVGTVGLLNAETKSLKWTLGIVAVLFAVAFTLATLTYQIARLAI